jgi:hypothetical protein
MFRLQPPKPPMCLSVTSTSRNSRSTSKNSKYSYINSSIVATSGSISRKDVIIKVVLSYISYIIVTSYRIVFNYFSFSSNILVIVYLSEYNNVLGYTYRQTKDRGYS